jgi:hydrogenase maturation protease
MEMNDPNFICIIGVGNTLRSDDGLGAYVCQALQQLFPDGVTIYIVHQLQTEWIPELERFAHVLIVDACTNARVLQILPAEGDDATPSSGLSHHITVDLLAAALRALGKTSPQFYTLAIPGENFDFGESLSSEALERAEEAVELIREWIGSLRGNDG